MKTRCDSCVFRSESKLQKCNYFFVTGQTRRGQPPEMCTYYVKGPRRDALKQPILAEPKRKERPDKRKYDLDRAMELWKAGATDREIAEAIGSNRKHVACWRRQNGLAVHLEPRVDRTLSKTLIRKYDWELARKLWEGGATDREIGLAIGCPGQQVGNWRRRRGMPSNKK